MTLLVGVRVDAAAEPGPAAELAFASPDPVGGDEEEEIPNTAQKPQKNQQASKAYGVLARVSIKQSCSCNIAPASGAALQPLAMLPPVLDSNVLEACRVSKEHCRAHLVYGVI